MEIQGLNLHAVQTAPWFTLISDPQNKGHLRLRALLNQSGSDVSTHGQVSIFRLCVVVTIWRKHIIFLG